MSGQRIAQIYFYLISIISIVLMIIGVYSIATFILNSTQYEKYPPRYFAEDCENYRFPSKGPYPALETPAASLSAQEREQLKLQCEKRLELERKQHKIEDIRNSVVFSLVGIILFSIHFPQAKKYSKN